MATASLILKFYAVSCAKSLKFDWKDEFAAEQAAGDAAVNIMMEALANPDLGPHPEMGLTSREAPKFILIAQGEGYRPGEIYLGRTRVGEALAGELRGLHART